MSLNNLTKIEIKIVRVSINLTYKCIDIRRKRYIHVSYISSVQLGCVLK